MTKVLIVDDHPLMREGLALSLNAEADLTVCGQAANSEEALAKLEQLDPDLVLMDISLPSMSGFELTRHIRALNVDVRVLVVSRHDEAFYAERAIRTGAHGYVMKIEAGDVLVKAVRRVVSGGIYVSENVSDKMLHALVAGRKEMTTVPIDVLSNRELEVFEHSGSGLGTRDIAEKLHLSVKTVESYRSRIKDKLGIKSAAEFMRRAVQWVEQDLSAD